VKLTMWIGRETWERVDPNEEKVETGPMGNCVSCVAVNGKDVRGFHGAGGIKAINFTELKRAVMDVAMAKIFVVFNGNYDVLLNQIKEIIDEEAFAFIEWRLYESSDAIIWRNGNVTHNGSNNPLPCRMRFISSLMPKPLVKKIPPPPPGLPPSARAAKGIPPPPPGKPGSRRPI